MLSFRRSGAILIATAAAALIAVHSWAASAQLTGRVVDENGIAVAGAQATLSAQGLPAPFHAVTDEAGRFSFPALSDGSYDLKVEKRGYYAFVSRSLAVSARAASFEITLNHRQEYEETVNVVYSAPTIDPQEAAAQTTLTSEEIVDLPFSASH